MAIVLYRESVAADQSLPTRTFQFGAQAVVTLRQEKTAQDMRTLTQVGTVVWQGAFVLAEYLLRAFPERYWHGRTALELGAGTGLVGIALAKVGAEVTLTDLGHILGILNENVASNLEKGAVEGRATVQELVWGAEVDPQLSQCQGLNFQVVIGAECIYQEEYFADLLETLKALFVKPSVVGYFSYFNRARGCVVQLADFVQRAREQKFLGLLAEAGFEVEDVANSELHTEYQSGLYHVICLRRAREIDAS